MLFWHLSDCRGVQGQEVELSCPVSLECADSTLAHACGAVTFYLLKKIFDCLISAWLLQYDCTATASFQVVSCLIKMDLTIKSRHPFTVAALTGLLRPITTRTK